VPCHLGMPVDEIIMNSEDYCLNNENLELDPED